MSPRNGTLLTVSRRSVSRMPPSTTVWPSLTSTWVVISRVSMLGTKPPVALGTTWPTLSLVTVRSRMMRSSGVICGVTFSDSTAFLNCVVVAPLEADSWYGISMPCSMLGFLAVRRDDARRGDDLAAAFALRGRDLEIDDVVGVEQRHARGGRPGSRSAG